MPHRADRQIQADFEEAEAAMALFASSLAALHDGGLVQLGDRTVVRVHGSEGAAGTAIRSGDHIVWMFSPTTVEKRPHSRTIAREKDYAAEVDGPEVAGFLSKMPAQAGKASARKYSGRRIDLDFKDADIHNILRLLSEVGGVNVVTADNVGGTVTIRMKDVPWDQALDIILKAKGLSKRESGTVMMIAPSEEIAAQEKIDLEAQQSITELAPIRSAFFTINFAKVSELAALFSGEASGGDGDEAAEATANGCRQRPLDGNGQFLDGIECFRQRADLVELDQDRIGNILFNATGENLGIGDIQVVTHQLALARRQLRVYCPTFPVVFSQAILDGDDGVLAQPAVEVLGKLL